MSFGLESGISAADPLPGDTRGSQFIRTPPVSPKPRINSARIFGARPGAPFLFTIATSGQKPLRFSATDLPTGIRLDAATGRLSGSAAVPGTYNARHRYQCLGSRRRHIEDCDRRDALPHAAHGLELVVLLERIRLAGASLRRGGRIGGQRACGTRLVQRERG